MATADRTSIWVSKCVLDQVKDIRDMMHDAVSEQRQHDEAIPVMVGRPTLSQTVEALCLHFLSSRKAQKKGKK